MFYFYLKVENIPNIIILIGKKKGVNFYYFWRKKKEYILQQCPGEQFFLLKYDDFYIHNI